MQKRTKPKHIVAGQKITEEKRLLARALRKDMTPAEKALWQCLKGDQMGVRFRRQQVIDGFIADFYCHQVGLVVEIDGATHDENYDEERSQVFAKRGLMTLRFNNNDVFQHIDAVVLEIRKFIKEDV